MNYGELRDSALKLINQYSIAGSQIPLSYNNQTDYVLRIPTLINEAQMYLASGPKRILASVYLDRDEAEHDAHMYRFILPEDCMGVRPGGLFVLKDGRTEYESHYTCMGEDHILVPDWITGDIYLEYYRRPQMLPMNPLDTAPIDNSLNAQMAIPYYVAAHLVMQDDAYQYSALYNEWMQKVQMLEEPPHAHQHSTVDVYDVGAWGAY